MMRRGALFVAGLLFGITLDMVPHLVEVFADINVCRESCPMVLRGVSIAIYAVMPIVWGVILAATVGKRHAARVLLTLVLASFALMLLVTWFLYAYQHPR
jgi:hypothetical protein